MPGEREKGEREGREREEGEGVQYVSGVFTRNQEVAGRSYWSVYASRDQALTPGGWGHVWGRTNEGGDTVRPKII